MDTQNNSPPVNFDKRVDQFVRLRDKIREIEEKHKKELEPFKAAKETLEGILLDHLNQVGADSVTAETGSVYRSRKDSASVSDMAAFWTHVTINGDFDMCDRKANVTAVRDYVDKNGKPPPGVSFTSRYTVGVRRPSSK